MSAQVIVGLATLGVIILGAGIRSVFYLGNKIGIVDTKLDTMLTNHLPHLEARMERVETKLMEQHDS